MRLLVTDFTLDPQQAKAATPVDPSGLVSFARQAPQLDSVQQARRQQSRQAPVRQRVQPNKLQVEIACCCSLLPC